MSYRALYRAWRPQTFSEVVGQEHVTRTLSNAVRHGKHAHAYLFCGPRGTGKTSTAKILAKAVNCPYRDGGDPCNSCPSCSGINAGTSVDFLEIDAASNRGVDEVRDLREKVKYRPAGSSFKVYIVDEVHMLTHEAFNALLKTLEEPPGHVMFILATTEPHKVPLTISSRCQRFDFRRISLSAITARLEDVAQGAGITCEPGVPELIARVVEGSLRDALGLLDQVAALGDGAARLDDAHAILGTVDGSVVAGFVDALFEGNAGAAIRVLHEVEAGGKDLRIFARELTDHLRGTLLQMVEKPGRQEGQRNLDSVVRLLGMLSGAEQEMRNASRQVLPLELAAVSFVRESPGAFSAEHSNPPTTPEKADPAQADNEPLSDRDLWIRVCQELKASRPPVAALLAKVTGVFFRPGRVTIRFKDGFALARMVRPENRMMVEETLARFSPGQWQVQCVKDEGPGQA